MKLFSDCFGFSAMMKDIFGGLNVTDEEKAAMQMHQDNSPYKRIDITRAWRDSNGILCVEYERDGNLVFFHYNGNGAWW